MSQVRFFITVKDSEENIVERCNSPNQNREISASDTFKWTGEQSNFLLEQYESQIENVGPMKRFRKKRNMWKYLCELCSEEFGKPLTIEQVEGRFKTIIKVAKNRIKRKGTIRKDVPYSDILENIIYRNVPKISKSFRPLEDAPRKKEGKSLHVDMIDKIIADKKERHKEKLEAKAKRHADKMDFLSKILAAKNKSNDSFLFL